MISQKEKKQRPALTKKVDKLLYAKPDYIDAFDDDYLYDCVEGVNRAA